MIDPRELDTLDFQVALFEGDADAYVAFNVLMAGRPGPIITTQGLTTDAIESGACYCLDRLVREVSLSVNTAAAGGNASLMMIG